jgi:putative transposase
MAWHLSRTASCPIHLHLLVYGTSLDADLQAFMIHFKKVTGFEYSKRFKRRLWQSGYHDRILRDDESTEATARYILENPVRAGLAHQIGEYPFAGSDLYDVRAILTAWDRQV